MNYWANKKAAMAVVTQWISQQDSVPDNVREAVRQMQIQEHHRTGVVVARPGYNCNLAGYFVMVAEKLKAAGGALSWLDVEMLFSATQTVFMKRYELFQKRYPSDAAKLRLTMKYGEEGGITMEENA